MKLWLVAIFLFMAQIGSAQDSRFDELSRRITRAEQLQKAEKHREAIAEYAATRALAVQIFGEKSIYVAAFSQAEGMLHRQVGDLARAETMVRIGIQIAREVRDDEFVAEGLNNLAAIRWDRAAYLESQKLHEQALAMMIQLHGENSSQVAVSRGNLAGAYKSMGLYSQAEPLFLLSVQSLRKHQPKYALELGDGLMNQADLHYVQGQFPECERLLLESLAVKRNAVGANHFEVGRTTNNLAGLYSSMGQYAKAEAMHKETLRTLEASLGSDHTDIARSLVNLAIAYQRQHRYDEAEPLYLRALDIRQRMLGKEHPDTAMCEHNMGGYYTARSNYPRAREVYESSLASRRQTFGREHPTVAYSLTALGALEARQKHYDAARKFFDEALAIRKKQLSPSHPDLAYSYSELGSIDAATAQWEASTENFDLARRGFRAHIDQVLTSLSESDQLTFLKEIDEPHYHTALSLVLLRGGDQAVIEKTANWVLNGKGVAQQAMSQRAIVARDNQNPQLAGQIKELLQVRKQLASLTMTTDSREADAQRQQRIDELSNLERNQDRQLALQSGRTASVGDWVETDAVRNAMRPNSVLVEIARIHFQDCSDWTREFEKLPERYVVWIIPAAGDDAIQAIDLGPADEIDQRVRTARTALQSAPAAIRASGEVDAEDELRPALKDLARQILYPILAHLQPEQKIILSPDSMLWLVPWCALPLEDDTYAIEKYDIHYVVTGRDLASISRPLATNQSIVFADPDYNLDPVRGAAFAQSVLRKPAAENDAMALRAASPTGRFKFGTAIRLPGTQAEAEAILPSLQSLDGREPIVYSQEYALEGIFKALHQPRVLMLSTHGFFQEDDRASLSDGTPAPPAINPLLRCGMLLSGCNNPDSITTGNREDGILTGLEIVGSDLRGTELVVLSACETGLGKVQNGEGVAGLRQAFQLAGARAIVSTLWQIPDRDTAKLMANFFAGLAQKDQESGVVDNAAALRASQLKLIEQRRDRNGVAHPFFWAAFTLTGQ